MEKILKYSDENFTTLLNSFIYNNRCVGVDISDQVKNIISAQIDREKRLEQADEIIINDGSMEELQEKVMILHTKYLSQC